MTYSGYNRQTVSMTPKKDQPFRDRVTITPEKQQVKFFIATHPTFLHCLDDAPIIPWDQSLSLNQR